MKSFIEEKNQDVSEIYLYEIEMNVQACDDERKKMSGYKIRISKIILEYRIDNGDPVYVLNENEGIEKKSMN